MAKLSFSMVMLFTIIVVMYAPAVVYGSRPSAAPSYLEPSEPKQLWDECLTKLTPKCALDIIDSVFGNGTVDASCCYELVKEGKVCHDSLIKYIAQRPSFRDHELEYEEKSDQLWKECLPKATYYPFEPINLS